MSDRIKTSIPAELSAWMVPNFARVVGTGDAIDIGLLEQDQLDELAALWLTGLYKRAGRPSPWSRS